ncbi:MAG: TlyA family RNA methyltransferase [Pseudomonadota bacterium]
MSKARADLLLVARGLAESRAQARAAIEAGGVRANGAPVRKPSDMLDESAALEFTPAHPWVSRGGVKLAHALDAFGIDPTGRICLDVGASTGGFTEVLLARGAAHVVALDVGKAQLHPRIAADARVSVREGLDARDLTAADLPEPPTLIVCDVSFIGASKALRQPLALAAPGADLIVLIKPQFEADGPARVKGGVLAEEDARANAEKAIASLDGLEGFRIVAQTDSPIHGGDGNLELLAHLVRP